MGIAGLAHGESGLARLRDSLALVGKRILSDKPLVLTHVARRKTCINNLASCLHSLYRLWYNSLCEAEEYINEEYIN